MANDSVAAPKAVEFFAFNASYLVRPGAEASELLNDAGCWLDSVNETVNNIACELTSEGSQMQANPAMAGKMLWGAWHLLEMVKGAVEAAQKAIAESEVRV